MPTPTFTISRPLWIAAFIGVVLFVLFNIVPIAVGNDPDAARHVIDRTKAAEAAEAIVRDRLGDRTLPLSSFAMYAADREVFGYFYEKEAIEDVSKRLSATLPLEAYRVELVDEDSGAIHWIDINPFTGQPSEWVLSAAMSGGDTLDADRLEALGRETIAAQGWTGGEPTLLSLDAETGSAMFELKDPAFHEANAVVAIRADGGGGVSEYTVQWRVPAAYTERIANEDAKSSALGMIGLLLSGLLQFAAFIYALARMGAVRWNRGIVMALFFGIVYCAMNVNMYPGMKATVLNLLNGGDIAGVAAELQTGGGAAIGLISALIVTNALTLALAIGTYFSAVAGDSLARIQGWSLWPMPDEGGYSSHVASAVKLGYIYAPILLGIQSILFMLAEQSIQTWYTIDALSSPNNMVYPAFAPLLAWCAAVSEEAVYRLFAIPALAWVFAWPLKLMRLPKRTTILISVGLAVVISSMIWALGHVQYPIYPYYTRFVEVTTLGLLFAFIFMRHGFLTAVFAHAVVDLVLFGLSIVASTPSAGNFAAYLFYVATPALIAFIVRQRRRRVIV